jgi:asparagine synthase (glutamine-hydrolysing)
MIGVRDPLGSWPLYYGIFRNHHAFGTSLSGLVETQGTASLNFSYIAEYFVRPFIPSEVSCQQTAVDNIQRVLPGTLVSIEKDGSLCVNRYWDWSNRICRVDELNLEDVAERFSGLLNDAIKERIQEQVVGAHLSGGMDSSTVAVLTARSVASRLSERIPTFSLVYQAPELTQERIFMTLVLEQESLLDATWIDADEAVGFDWFRQEIPPHDEPYVGLWAIAANRLLVNAARQQGVDTILTGVGGDEILSYRPLHIASLLRQGRLCSAICDASIWASARGEGTWSVLKKCGLIPNWPHGLDQRGKSIAKNG